jgi:Leucine-rich repeat (LRR) protein
MRQNLIKKIEGLATLVNLRELDLRDNELEVIEGLETLTQLT